MKKYMLPEIEIVELRLNERIAADCEMLDDGSVPPPGAPPSEPIWETPGPDVVS